MTRKAKQTDAEEALPVDLHLTGFIGYFLKHALSLVEAALAQVLGALELRAVSFSSLMVVVRDPRINQTQLVEALKIERSNLVQLIDEFSGFGILARTPIAGDRRS